jgi:hypothetical protein
MSDPITEIHAPEISPQHETLLHAETSGLQLTNVLKWLSIATSIIESIFAALNRAHVSK